MKAFARRLFLGGIELGSQQKHEIADRTKATRAGAGHRDLQRIGSTATLAASEGDQHVVEITTEGNTYVLRRACTGAGQAAKCLLAQSFAKFDDFGTTLALANSLNIQKMRVSTVMLLPDESTLVGAKVVSLPAAGMPLLF